MTSPTTSCATAIRRKAIPPLYGALLKNEQDVHLLERLAFMQPQRATGLHPCALSPGKGIVLARHAAQFFTP
jgi:hypothetical protein